MDNTLRVLIIEDSEDDAVLIVRMLVKAGFKPSWKRVESKQALLDALDNDTWDIILSDYNMPGFDGKSALDVIKQKDLDIPFIVISGILIEENAVEILKAGANDFVKKGHWARFIPAVERELREAKVRREKKKAKKAREEAEARFYSLFDKMHEGVFQCHPDGRFIMVNPAMARILGYLSPADIKRNITDFLGQLFYDPKEGQDLIKQLHEQQSIKGRETRLNCKNGRVIWVSMHTYAEKLPDNRLKFFEGWVEDITDRKKNEQELVQYRDNLEQMVAERTRQLEKANAELKKAKEAADSATRAKSEFLANMSHEIRTPMNGVITAAELALEEEMSPKVRKYVDIISHSARLLLNIINDILDFSKIESGKLNLEAASFQLDEIFDKLIDMFSERVAEKNIEFLIDIDPQTPMALVGDPLRINQVLTNLLSNAIKFTDKEGLVVVGVKLIETTSKFTTLEFFVQDTGIGISPEYHHNLFTPFTQQDASTTRQYGGTGLGLTICKQLVEMMDGEIWLESEVGKGSIFHFNLRLNRHPATEAETAQLPEAIQKLQVLVVDQSILRRQILEKILVSWGFDVELAESGKQAVYQLFESQTQPKIIDLVISNNILPDMNAGQLYSKIRKQLGSSIPLIIMTDHKKDTIADDIIQETQDGLIYKPITPHRLFDRILEVFNFSTFVDPGQLVSTVDMALFKKQLPGKNVLIVEDNLTNQEIAFELLSGVGMSCQIANNGKEAVQAVKHNPYDVILMDVQMPELDGCEATRQIRQWEAENSRHKLPIIAMTAHAMKGDEEKCIAAGMDAYVAKPVCRDELLKILTQTMETKKTDSSFDTLPSKSADRKTGTPLKNELKGRRILLVEDNPTNQIIASSILEELGVELEIANNGAEALAAVKVQSFDLVLMDVIMPQMDGYEATRFIRNYEAQIQTQTTNDQACISNRPKRRNLPIIAMTASVMEGDKEKCLKAGMDAYISKPIDREQLVDIMIRFL